MLKEKLFFIIQASRDRHRRKLYISTRRSLPVEKLELNDFYCDTKAAGKMILFRDLESVNYFLADNLGRNLTSYFKQAPVIKWIEFKPRGNTILRGTFLECMSN